MVTSNKMSDDIITLSEERGLYLQPYCRINIKAQIPEIKGVGKSISNWEIMEKLRAAIQPYEFSLLKVESITREMVTFEGELLTRQSKKPVLHMLNGKQLKLSGFSSAFALSASENKSDNYPTQHDWESFFADMDQTEYGERPDTVVIDNLPCYWFMDPGHHSTDHKPNQDIVMQVFSKFGTIRCLHIPLLDKYHKSADNPFQTFSFNNQLNFKVYIQYEEYQGFCLAIHQLKGMKLQYRLNRTQDGQKKEMLAKIQVDFDKTGHLNSKNIRKRRFEKLKLQQLEKEADDKAKLEQQKKEELERQRESERKRQEEERRRQQLEEEKRRKERYQEKRRQKNQRQQLRQQKRERLRQLQLQLQNELDQRRKNAEEKLAVMNLENKNRAKQLLTYLLQQIANVRIEKVRKCQEEERKRKQLAGEESLRRRLINKIKKQESRKRALKRELLCRQIDGSLLRSAIVKK
ncbi:uncharacterized protein TRIADDRAFT_56831 [Trichoplax adhaerens]|uniref:RRM domain-containing protein n=1 Tax=Trichoplax adhaerens TaxID=10228 RepID=B3RWP6_TRIAD|nr:hypothetical protein TRIADDRAFT_56831 [Trichoplax adhaerens]EDV24733.1 hypothetical protein TRIADDRAFT_56831 [Trichoplax adhaerens]|eukprot:XP_002112623.1 hypothetical protein TRIADDRAFT_56831 [Trichoplax adhaerens]